MKNKDYKPSLDLFKNTNNVVVIRTFSKIYGLAGARVGYAIANSKTIDQLSELKSWASGSISVASTAAALATLNDEKFVLEALSLNKNARQFTIENLKKLKLELKKEFLFNSDRSVIDYVLANNTAKRRDGIVVNISTAGHDLDSLMGRLYQRGMMKEAGKAEDPEFYFKWYGAYRSCIW